MRNNEIIDFKGNLGMPMLIHTHAAKGTAEEITGFKAGALIRIWAETAIDPGYVGSTAEMAILNAMGFEPAIGDSFIFRTKGSTFWFDGQTAGVYRMHQLYARDNA